MNAVDAEHLSGCVSVVGFEEVFLSVAVVRFLDTSACRGIVACHSEAQTGAVAEVELFLHEAFAEGASSDDGASVVILQRACHYLAC